MTMQQQIVPLGNRVLIKRSNAQTTKGGIILPDSAKEKPKTGEVVAVGPGKVSAKGVLSPMHVQTGDTVLFSSYAGTEVEDGQFLLVSEDEILGVLI